MAGLTPTEAAVDNALIDFATLIEHMLDNGTEVTNPLSDDLDALLTATTYPGSESLRATAINSRLSYSNLIREQARAGYATLIRAYLRVAGYPNVSWPSTRGHKLFRDWWIANSKLIQDRSVSYDTSANQAGTGTPTVRRLTVDEDGYDLEAVWPTTTYIEAIQVQPETNVGEETLRLYLPSGMDLFSPRIAGEENGDGKSRTYTLVNSDSEIQDHSFGLGVATAGSAPASSGRWTDNAGDFITSVTVVDAGFRQSTEERRNYNANTSRPQTPCLNVADEIDIQQDLPSVSFTEAYDAGYWVKRTGTITGNVNLDVGDITVTQSIAGLSLNTWTFVGLPLTASNWGRNISGDDPKFRIYTDTLSISSGTLLIDTAVFRPMVWHNGTKWHIQPGATVIGEDFTDDYTDAISTDSVVARHMSFSFPPQYQIPSGGTPSARLSESGI